MNAGAHVFKAICLIIYALAWVPWPAAATLKRWAKGLLALALAWLGGFSEMPILTPDDDDEEE